MDSECYKVDKKYLLKTYSKSLPYHLGIPLRSTMENNQHWIYNFPIFFRKRNKKDKGQ